MKNKNERRTTTPVFVTIIACTLLALVVIAAVTLPVAPESLHLATDTQSDPDAVLLTSIGILCLAGLLHGLQLYKNRGLTRRTESVWEQQQ